MGKSEEERLKGKLRKSLATIVKQGENIMAEMQNIRGLEDYNVRKLSLNKRKDYNILTVEDNFFVATYENKNGQRYLIEMKGLETKK